MAIVPSKVTLTKSASGILNAVRNGIGGDYYAGVPEANDTTASIRAVGTAILAQQSRRNAFVETLVNRIGMEILRSRQYQNPWAMFKKGFLEYGETVEEIFVNLCEVRGYSLEQAPTRVLQNTKPSVSVAFHTLNIRAEYPVTITNANLRQAFLSADALLRFIDGIINNMYTSMNYDELLLMQYELALLALNGELPKKVISTPAAGTAAAIATDIKEISNEMVFMKDKYTISGNKNFTVKEDQYILEQTGLNAVLDVNVLATSFNMDKAEFQGHVVLMDNLGDMDNARLAKLLDKDSDFAPFTATQLGYLAKIRALICARDFFQIYDVEQTMEDFRNGSGLSWNYFLHKWQIVSASPFENVCLLTDQASTVSSITVALDASTMSAAGTNGATATVTTTGFASKDVTWSLVVGTGTAADLTNGLIAIDDFGVITLKTGYHTGTWTVTATSKEDGSTTGTATLTLS